MDVPRDNQSNVEQWLQSNEEDAERIKNFFAERSLSSLFVELYAGVHETGASGTRLEQHNHIEDGQAVVLHIEPTGVTFSQSHENNDSDRFREDADTAIPPSSISSRVSRYEQETLTSGSVTRMDGEEGSRYLGEPDTPDEADDTPEGLPAQQISDIAFNSMQKPQVPSSFIEFLRKPVEESSYDLTEEEYQNFRKQPQEVQKRSLQVFFECLVTLGPRLGKGLPLGEKFSKKKWNEEFEALAKVSEHCSGQTSKDGDNEVPDWADKVKDNEVSI